MGGTHASVHGGGHAGRRRRALQLLLAVLLAAGFLPWLEQPAAAAESCQASITASVRGKQVTLDQCYAATRDIGGTEFGVLVYYRETPLQANSDQCTADDAAGRCEHELPDNDDANGDNVAAVTVGDETLDALEFYISVDLSPLPSDEDTIKVLVAEDPRGGGVITPDTLYWDDDLVATGLSSTSALLTGRILAEHESMHLVQDRFEGDVGFRGFYGEGIARAIEDRIDPTLDAQLNGLFIPEVNGILGNETARTSTIETVDYPTVLFWTYLLDRYAAPGDVEPQLGWGALKDYYDVLIDATDQVEAVSDFAVDNGASFYSLFTAYAQSLWAYRFGPPSPLGFTDAEVNASGNQLSGHPTIDPVPAYPSTTTYPVAARSVNYVEYLDPACDFVRIDVDGNGDTFTYAAMAADAGAFVGGWESTGPEWTRTVRTTGVDRVAALVVGRENAGSVDITSGCMDPTIDITSPTSSQFAIAGAAENPRTFIVRLDVDAGGSPVAGLLATDFDAVLRPLGGGGPIPADIVTATYVLDDYWLLVQAPDAAAGAVTGSFYDLEVTLGGQTASEAQSVLYVERSFDSVIVLDRSGSMLDFNKIQAAKNAANLFVNQLAGDDQGAFVAFDTNVDLREPLDEADNGDHRGALVTAIEAEPTLARTSIGSGMQTAATEHDDNGDDEHVCTFVLLSDGHENEPEFWEDVRDEVADNGCAVHAIALGPEANEPLMQEIASIVAGGSYDYAPSQGDVGVGGGSAGGPSVGEGGGDDSSGVVGWQNNLANIYDYAASQSAGRQRIFAADGDGTRGSEACSDETSTTGYTELVQPKDRYEVGDGFTSDGIAHTVLDYTFVNGNTTAGGAVSHDPGAADPVLFMGNARVQPTLPSGACRIEVAFVDLGGSTNLTVNDDDRAVEDLTELDGQVVGGADVAVDVGRGGSTLVVTGAISQFAIGGQELEVDDLVIQVADDERFAWVVDPADDELVVTFSWQDALMGQPDITVLDPGGTAVPTAQRRVGDNGRNQVWTIPTPQPGLWTARVGDLPTEYLVTAQVESLFELRAYAGAGVDDVAGTRVPILASFTRPGGPVTGALVFATVTTPDGDAKNVLLFDDGAHGDGDADDGVYGASFLATASGDVLAGGEPEEGEAPEVAGSYLVDVVGLSGDVRREAQASFALTADRDDDRDGLPNRFEARYPQLDPADPSDAGEDPDRDGVTTLCELHNGTEPFDPDTDRGGEQDGSELGPLDGDCRPGPKAGDPLDPGDDDLEPTDYLSVFPWADADGPHVLLFWSGDQPDGTLFDLRRTCDGGTLERLGRLTENRFVDRDVADGDRCTYTVQPRSPDGETGPPVDAAPVDVKEDVFAPDGMVLIDGGAATTPDTIVDLELTADDSGQGEGDGAPPAAGVSGDAVGDLEMRFGTSPAAAQSAPWVPFASTVEDVDLGDVAPGTVATVYVQFRDTSGNESGLRHDSILVVGDTRLGGEDRIATGAVIAGAAFDDGEAEVAVLARADQFADALAGTPLAIRRGGPLLLTSRTDLSPAVATELQRVLPAGRTVFLLGGEAALAPAVATAVEALGYEVVRLAGPTRYETAVAIAEEVGEVDHVLVARGDDFPDALTAGAAAGRALGAVVLTPADTPHPATDAYLERNGDAALWAIGGPAARAYPALTALSGADRFATAVAVADEFFVAPPAVGVSRSDNFADSLGGGVHVGRLGGPVMLTPPTSLAPATEQYVCDNPTIDVAFVYGGPVAVSDDVAAAVAARVEGTGC